MPQTTTLFNLCVCVCAFSVFLIWLCAALTQTHNDWSSSVAGKNTIGRKQRKERERDGADHTDTLTNN